MRGELFFASSNDLVYQFDYAGDPSTVVIDLSRRRLGRLDRRQLSTPCSASTGAQGKTVTIVGLEGPSLERLEQLSGRMGAGH